MASTFSTRSLAERRIAASRVSPPPCRCALVVFVALPLAVQLRQLDSASRAPSDAEQQPSLRSRRQRRRRQRRYDASQPQDPPAGVDLARAATAVLTRGCSSNGATSGEGVACQTAGLPELLSAAPSQRFDERRRQPCTASPPHVCVPYFYVLGAFHSGARDLYDRIAAHPSAFVPKSLRDGSYPYYFSETHSWERMLWRGCDYGGCPRRRGVGAQPVALSAVQAELEEQVPGGGDGGGAGGDGGGAGGGGGRVFGEVMGGGLTFTWSCAHSLLHHAWDKNQSGCRMHPRRPCFPLASEAQREWEASIGAGSQRQFTIPWLMRAVHGDKVRLIALLREPAERMHSAYYFWPQYRRRWGLGKKANALPDGFLEYVQHVLPAFESCLRSAKLSAVDARAAHFSPAEMPPALPLAAGRHQLRETAAEAAERVALEHCAINFESLSSDNEAVYYHADQLLKSLYVAYVPSWLKAFGSERMLFLRAEDYWDGRRDTLGKVFNFLGLGPPPAAAFDAIVDRPISVLTGSNATFWGEKRIVNSHLAVPHPAAPAAGHGHTRSRIKAPMNAEARALLRDFFRPHNRRLARVLGDERFRWE